MKEFLCLCRKFKSIDFCLGVRFEVDKLKFSFGFLVFVLGVEVIWDDLKENIFCLLICIIDVRIE